MSRPRVDQCGNVERGVRYKWRRKWNAERIRIGKSGCVESEYLGVHTRGTNAVLRLCGNLRTA